MPTLTYLASGLVLSATCALSIPLESPRVHEARNVIPSGWTISDDALDKSSRFPMKIALSQSNLDKLDDYIMSVSHPESGDYGRHWSASKVAETFAPSHNAFAAVQSWLESRGIVAGQISRSASMGWLNLNVTVAEAEMLLTTTYNVYRHRSGQAHIACEKYHVPHEVADHIGMYALVIEADVVTDRSGLYHAYCPF